MTDIRQQTIDTYNESAQQLADYFSGIGPRTGDIDKAFELTGNTKGRVFEIGCGDGRDAAEIIKKADWYQGLDVSRELLRIAQARLPKTSFIEADAATFDYPKNLDIVFAFASLLHLDKDEVTDVLRRIHNSLNPGGIFYISLKYRDTYQSEIKTDKFGTRLFYFYNPQSIKKLANNLYETVYENRDLKGQTEWFQVALRKV
jgi:SAM-dependent methyltransferase